MHVITRLLLLTTPTPLLFEKGGRVKSVGGQRSNGSTRPNSRAFSPTGLSVMFCSREFIFSCP